MKLKYFLLALVIGTGTTTTKAQDYDLGVFGGLSFYQGDLAPGFSNGFVNGFRGMRPAIGGLARYNFHPNFSVRGNLNFGYVAMYDHLANEGTDREPRNLSFHSPIIEASAMIEINLRKYIAGSQKWTWTPYVFAGAGFAWTKTQTWYDGKRYALRTLPTEMEKARDEYWGKRAIQPVIPMGVGFKYNIDRNWTLGFEFGWRMMFTDYLDDVSGSYTGATPTGPTDMGAILGDRTGIPMPAGSKRGNKDANDSYYFMGLTLCKTIRPYQCR
jgi:hypothetical protein